MSMPYSIIKCESCSEHWPTHVIWGLFSYCLSDGRFVSIARNLAWCSSCNNFAPVEYLPDEKELEEKLVAASDQLKIKQQPKEYRAYGLIKRLAWPKASELKFYEQDLDEAQASIDWRAARKSGPKCLRCGSSDIDKKGLWDKKKREFYSDIEHPGCGGELSIEDSGMRLSLRHKHRFYDSEGNFLKERSDHS